MNSFRELTRRGRLLTLRGMAERALAAYGLSGARLTFVQYGENAIYRVDAPPGAAPAAEDGPYIPNRYALRIHAMNDEAAIASEIDLVDRVEPGGGPARTCAGGDAGRRAPGQDRRAGDPARARSSRCCAGWTGGVSTAGCVRGISRPLGRWLPACTPSPQAGSLPRDSRGQLGLGLAAWREHVRSPREELVASMPAAFPGAV